MSYLAFPPDEEIQELNRPIPDMPHHVSISLPRWTDNIAVEKGQLALINGGYPRIFPPPLYHRLLDRYKGRASGEEKLIVFPSPEVAEKCIEFTGAEAARVELTDDGVSLAIFPDQLSATDGDLFRKCDGRIVSTRQIEGIVSGIKTADDGSLRALREFNAALTGTLADNNYLYPTGMGAVSGAFEAVISVSSGPIVQLGVLYTDTAKLLDKFGERCGRTYKYIAYDSPDDLEVLRTFLAQNPGAVVFCEIPNNPLLRTIPLDALQDILRAHGGLLVIDNTLGPPVNVNLLPYGSILVNSLTKFVSGVGNVMGGVATLAGNSPQSSALKACFERTHQELLYPGDARVLLANAQGFVPRMRRINSNTLDLYHYLKDHSAVDRIYYTAEDPHYNAIRIKPHGGFGGLLSFTLKDRSQTPNFYNKLRVRKGPSLGTEFTLVSANTILAFFDRLKWAERNGMSEYLIRVSVGMEDLKEIKGRFEEALPPRRGHAHRRHKSVLV